MAEAVKAVDADAVAGNLGQCVRWSADVDESERLSLNESLGKPTLRLSTARRSARARAATAAGPGRTASRTAPARCAGCRATSGSKSSSVRTQKRHREKAAYVRGLERLDVWLDEDEYLEMMSIPDLNARFDWILQHCGEHVIDDLKLPDRASDSVRRSYVAIAYLLAQVASTDDEREQLLHYASKISTSLDLSTAELQYEPAARRGDGEVRGGRVAHRLELVHPQRVRPRGGRAHLPPAEPARPALRGRGARALPPGDRVVAAGPHRPASRR